VADEHTAEVAEQAHPSGADPDLVRSRVEDALATSRPVFNDFFLARLLDLTVTHDEQGRFAAYARGSWQRLGVPPDHDQPPPMPSSGMT